MLSLEKQIEYLEGIKDRFDLAVMGIGFLMDYLKKAGVTDEELMNSITLAALGDSEEARDWIELLRYEMGIDEE